MATGVPATAAVNAKTSIRSDPGDGIFWWTEAAAERRLGDQAAAITAYRAALADDPTEFPVANNLGVLLMKRGADNAAVAALRRSVGANPRYAIGWFNLGIALDRLGPAHLLAAAGSSRALTSLTPNSRRARRDRSLITPLTSAASICPNHCRPSGRSPARR